MKIIKKITAAVLVSLPLAAGARVKTVDNIIAEVQKWVVDLVPILIGVTVLVLMVGIIRYITSGEDEEKRSKARGLMIYGIIGLFVMVSIWGLVNFLGATLGIDIEPFKDVQLVPTS